MPVAVEEEQRSTTGGASCCDLDIDCQDTVTPRLKDTAQDTYDFQQVLENVSALCGFDLEQEAVEQDLRGGSASTRERRARLLLPPARGIVSNFGAITDKLKISEKLPKPSLAPGFYDVANAPWPAKAPQLNASFKGLNVLSSTSEPSPAVPLTTLADLETSALASVTSASFADWTGSALQQLLLRMTEILAQPETPSSEDLDRLRQMTEDATDMSRAQGDAIFEMRQNMVSSVGVCRVVRRQAWINRLVGVPEDLKVALRSGPINSPELFEDGVLTKADLREHETHQFQQALLKDKVQTAGRQPFRERTGNTSNNNNHNTTTPHTKKRFSYQGKRDAQRQKGRGQGRSDKKPGPGKRSSGNSGSTSASSSSSSSASKYRKL